MAAILKQPVQYFCEGSAFLCLLECISILNFRPCSYWYHWRKSKFVFVFVVFFVLCTFFRPPRSWISFLLIFSCVPPPFWTFCIFLLKRLCFCPWKAHLMRVLVDFCLVVRHGLMKIALQNIRVFSFLLNISLYLEHLEPLAVLLCTLNARHKMQVVKCTTLAKFAWNSYNFKRYSYSFFVSSEAV